MALELEDVVRLVNTKKLIPPKLKKLWEESADRISFHAKGIRPQFYNTRKDSGEYIVTPANWDNRYRYLVDNYILNRHPNERIEHYNWRLSTFPLVAQEIYINAKSQILGSIYQTSQYTIESNDEKEQDYLNDSGFFNELKHNVPEHAFTDPFGKYAIVEGHYEAFTSSEEARPEIEFIESRNILHFKEKEEIFFLSANQYEGRDIWYWIDRVRIVRFVKGVNGKEMITSYDHNIGIMPVVNNDSDFFKPFVAWADMLCRNMSDDEVIAKNASYPHITMIEPKCTECNGTKVKRYECSTCPDGFGDLENCRGCGGSGTISVNPGHYFVQQENKISGQETTLQQRIRFDAPPIEINEFSWKRVQEIREYGLRSMHLLFSDKVQSGEAKEKDREQLRYLLVNVTDKLFEINEWLLYFYLYMLGNREPSYTIAKPTQFNIKTESDVQLEYKELAAASADLTIRRRKQNELMMITLTGNAVGIKRWNVVKNWDYLWGMSSEDLSDAKLVANAPQSWFMRHNLVDVLLENILLDKGDIWIEEQPIGVIMTELDRLLLPLLPPPPVIVPSVNVMV